MEFKLEKLTNLIDVHKQIFVYGTGGLARAVVEVLLDKRLPFKGFVGQLASSPLVIRESCWPVFALDKRKHRGLVIAAQPVRSKVSLELKEAGWQEWQDFMVIA
jgi:hypothetical protein